MHQTQSMKRRSELRALEERTKRSLKYYDWYSRRYNLYFLSVPPASMSLDTTYKIDVIAEGRSTIVRRLKFIRDETLDRSLITRKSAEETRGPRRSIPRTTVTVINGQELSSEGTIELRWWLADTAVTRLETFYLVDSCGGYDAMFRGNIGPIDPRLGPGCSTLVHDRETRDKEKERKAKKQTVQEQRERGKTAFEERIRQNAHAQRENSRSQHRSPNRAG